MCNSECISGVFRHSPTPSPPPPPPQPSTYLIKRSHRFISRSDLDHIEISAITITIRTRTLSSRLVYIIPSTFTTHNVIDRFSLHWFTLVVFTGEDEFVGACAAFKTVGTHGWRTGDGECVAALGAEEEHCAVGWSGVLIRMYETGERVAGDAVSSN
jgi:hypothetical protein